MLGVDVANAAVNKTFSIAYTAGAPPTVAVTDGTTTVNATWTVASDQKDGTAPTRDIYTLDTGSLGVRLTVSVAAGLSASAALAGLNLQTVTSAGPETISNQYAQEISTIGVLSSTAKSQSANQLVLVTQVQQQRQQVGGVSLDEEATHMVQYQRAYQAAARVISVMDGMLDTLINHTKL
jgi:flagellar hook-associated protein FlgK